MSCIMGSGGRRKGAGRPVGTGKFKVPTKTMRIPIDMDSDIEEFVQSKGQSIALYYSTVRAGHPAPVNDEHEPERVNLFKHIVENPSDTFLLTANGDSMIMAGIHTGDLLVVDRKKEIKDGMVVVASINGEFTVKRLKYKNSRPYLMPENKQYKPIPVKENDDVQIFGAVTHSIHSVD